MNYNLEEMATIGNNDLSPNILYQLADPSDDDGSKVSPNNIRFFYTFEIDVDNPPIFSITDEGQNKMIFRRQFVETICRNRSCFDPNSS